MNLPKFNLAKYFPPKQSNNVIVKSQLYSASDSPFQAYLNGYEPLRYNLKIYNILREAIPILDVAVLKLRRLIGDFEYRCDNPNVLKALNNFKKEIKVGYFHKGLHGCLQQVYDSALANGYGVFETVPFAGLNGVDRLKVGDASKVRFIRKDGRLWLASIPHDAAKPVILEHPEFVQYLTFDLRDGHPQGVSLFNSMPFVAEILLRIQQSIKNAVVRIGDPTFVLLIEGGVSIVPW